MESEIFWKFCLVADSHPIFPKTGPHPPFVIWKTIWAVPFWSKLFHLFEDTYSSLR